MHINKENIEAYLLDYQEGNLTEEQVQELHVFLLLHPEYNEFLDIDLPSVTETEYNFENKKELYKFSSSADELLVKDVERTLTDEEKKELELLLKIKPELKKERKLFTLTVLEPVQINFPFKEQLKKRTGILIPLYPRVLQMAALFLLALVTATVLYFYSDQSKDQVVVSDATPVNKSEILINDTAQQSVTTAPEQKTELQLAETKSPAASVKRNKIPDSKEKENSVAQTYSEQPEKLKMIEPSLAAAPVVSPAPSSVPATYIPTHVLAEDRMMKSEDEFLTFGQLAERMLYKISKGRVGIIHRDRPDGSVSTELAISAGSFQFSHKKFE